MTEPKSHVLPAAVLRPSRRTAWQLLRYVALATGVLASATVIPAQSRIYTPAAPAGENSATYAAPRDDWFVTVQRKFDRYSGKPAEIIFDGDSITNRWETTGKAVWDEHFAGRAADFGVEGDRTENVLWRLSKGQVTGVNPKLVVLMIGTNNVVRNNADEITAGIESVVQQYESLCPSAHILLMAVFPRGKDASDPNRLKVAEVNTELQLWLAHTNDPRVTFVDIGKQLMQEDGTISPDMMPDMLHPKEAGYRIWADAIQPYVEKYASDAPQSASKNSPPLDRK